jgi:hypothetical protein
MLLREITSMAGLRINRVIAGFIAGAMVVSSTSAAAAVAPVPQQMSPWVALAGLSAGAPAATLCGSAAVISAAQAPVTGCVLPVLDTPPPVAEAAPVPGAPPAVVTPAAYAVSPIFLALGALALGSFVYFLVRDHHHTVSPA